MQVFDGHLDEVLNEHLSEFFPDLEVSVLRVEQVLYLFLVYLVEGDVHFPVQQRTLLALRHLLLKEAEDEIERRGDDSLGIETYLVQNTH